jgi:xanthine dehydrogenase accessory factor
MNVLERLSHEREPCALATVIATEGSSPAKATMRMLVGAQGRLTGSVGGGRVELEVETKARETIETGAAAVLSFTLDDDMADEGGLICGGTVRILVERVEPPAGWAGEAANLIRRGRRGVLLARIGDTVERELLTGAHAEPYLVMEQPRVEDDLFVEPLLSPRCIIVGAGHVGRAAAQVANVAGLHVAVVEDRADLAAQAQGIAADVVCDELVSGFESLDPGPDDLVLVMTRTHGLDLRCVRAALLSPVRYVGMLASRRKASKIREALAAEGVEALRLHAPVGLDLGATSAGEIAVAVVAQLVKVRRMGRGDR